tara:strand:+ start:2587 stop:2799 length:213 start_codon:yes stop_codon:yes gene_type:complete
MSREDAIRKSLFSCMNKIQTLDDHKLLIKEMHFLDVERLILEEFYKLIKLLHLNHVMKQKSNTELNETTY